MFLSPRTFLTSNLLRKCSLNYIKKAMEANDIHLGNLALLKKCTEPYACSKKGETECSSECNTFKRKDIKNPSPEHNKVFIQTFSPILGKLEWEVQNEDYDYIQEVARSAYADMLHDDERNELYYVGVREAVRILRSKGQSVRVLDIGTGTGLLSMMAVSCGADVVTACEAFEPMAECAEKILAANNMADKVHVIHKRSTDLCVGPGLDMAERANLLVAEVFDTELIGEGAISTYSHAKKFLLTPDALLVPSAARVYAQVVCSPALHAFSRPYANISRHLPVPQLRLPSYYNECPGSISVHDVQMSQLSHDSFTPLSDPMVVFKFDWSGRTIPLSRNETTRFQFQPAVTTFSEEKSRNNRSKKLDGKNTTAEKRNNSCEQYVQNQPQQIIACSQMTCHAVLMWWDLVMDQAGDVILTCAPYWEQQQLRAGGSSSSVATGPNTVPWRDHWMQAVYHLPPPLVRVSPRVSSSPSLLHAASPEKEPHSQSADDVELTLTAARDEYSMWFSVTESHKSSQSPPSPIAPHCSCGTHMTTPRSRLAQLSDTRRITAYSRAVNDTLDRQQDAAARAWLVLGDGVNLLIIGQIAFDHRVSHVFVHEPRQQGRRALRAFIADNNLERKITLLPEKLAKLTKDMLKQEIGVVFSEPYFNTSLLPWHNLCANSLLATCSHLLPSSHASADETSEEGYELAMHQQLNSQDLSNTSRTNDLTDVLSTTTNQEVMTNREDTTNQEVTCISPKSSRECNTTTPDSRSQRHPTMSQSVSRPLTSALVLPGSAALYVMPVSFLHLWKIRAPCEQRCGFDLGIFDELIDKARSQTDDYVEPQPLWEYPCYALHSPILLKTLDLTTSFMTSEFEEKGDVHLDFGVLVESAKEFQNLRQNCFGNRGTQKNCANANFSSPCAVIQDDIIKCNSGETVAEAAQRPVPSLSEVYYNGVTLWVDWNFGHAGAVTTGPVDEVRVGKQVRWDATTQQGVHLPRRSVPLQQDGYNTFHYSVHWKRGQMTFSFDVTTGER